MDKKQAVKLEDCEVRHARRGQNMEILLKRKYQNWCIYKRNSDIHYRRRAAPRRYAPGLALAPRRRT